MSFGQIWRLLAPLAFVLVTVIGYAAALSGGFFLDDHANILDNPHVTVDSLNQHNLAQALSGPGAGPLGRPVSYLSFAINHAISGPDAYAFKATNLALHILCGLSLFVFVLQLAKATLATQKPHATYWLAAFITAWWLWHPQQLSTVMYAVQRMTILATLFVLLGLISYMRGRQAFLQERLWPGMAWLLLTLLCLILGSLSKENGLLLLPVLLAVEIIVYQAAWPSPKTQFVWRLAIASAALLPIAGIAIYHQEISNWVVAGYQNRDFTLVQRLWTQSRVVCMYLYQWLLPDARSMTLFHDGFTVSTGPTSPLSTVFATMGMGALLVGGVLSCWRWPLFGFGIVLFLLGHSLESSVIGLELAFEHRNYLPSIGLVIAAAPLVNGLLSNDTMRRPAILGLGAGLIILSISLSLRAQTYATPWNLLDHTLRYHADSPRGQVWAGSLYQNALESEASPPHVLLEKAKYHFQRAATLSPSNTEALFRLLWLQIRFDGHAQSSTVADLTQRLAHAPLSVETVHALQQWILNALAYRSVVPMDINQSIIDAALINPHMPDNRARAMIYWSAGLHYGENLQDLGRAIPLLNIAHNANPSDRALALALAMYLARQGNCEDAKDLVDEYRNSDRNAEQSKADTAGFLDEVRTLCHQS